MGFDEKVWNLCKRIPKCKVTTYKEIARAIPTEAYRAVGNALNRNPHSPVVPCRMVVRSDGSIGGFAKGKKKKIRMLEKEGIKIDDKRVINLNLVLYKY